MTALQRDPNGLDVEQELARALGRGQAREQKKDAEIERLTKLLKRWIKLDLSRGPLDEGRRFLLWQLEDNSVAALISSEEKKT